MDQTQIERIPDRYKQPIQDYLGRNLNDLLENIDFVPGSHLRIWYNNQQDNYSLHHHDALEVIVCMENRYKVVTEQETYILNEGDILMLPPHMLHEICCDSPGVRFVLLFDIDFFKNFHDFNYIDSLFQTAFLCTAENHANIYKNIYDTFMKIIDTYFNNSVMWEVNIYSMLLDIYVKIGREYYYLNESASLQYTSQKPRENYEKISNLLNYIDTNYAKELSLEQAADYIGFSKYHFARMFKQHTNTTFYEYLCHKRVDAACNMLETDIPITSIAFQTGFNNLTSFCRCFKKYMNCSPSEYRNRLHTRLQQ